MKKLETIENKLKGIESKAYRLLGDLLDSNMSYTRDMVSDLIIKIQHVQQCYKDECSYDENGIFIDDYDKNIEEWLDKVDQGRIHTKTLYPTLLEYNKWCLKKEIRGIGRLEFVERLRGHGIILDKKDNTFNYDAH